MSSTKDGSTLPGREFESGRDYAKRYNAWQEYGALNNYRMAVESCSFTQDELEAIRDSLTVSLCLLETGCVYLNAVDTENMSDATLERCGAKRRGPTEEAKPQVEKVKAILAKVAALLK